MFDHFTAELPGGFTSLIGPNGSGKSTFLLLASGRLVPQNGTALLFGQNAAALSGEEKNLLASVIFQNMEFETTEKVKELLEFVYKNVPISAIDESKLEKGDVVLYFGPRDNHGLIYVGENKQKLLL